MRILTPQGMIDIEAAGLLYCNIKRMYKSGHGYGLQLDKELGQARDKIKNACDKIAEDIYGLQDILREHYLQLDKELEQARDKIKNTCDKIADNIYELQDILEGYYKNISELERYYGDISEEPW